MRAQVGPWLTAAPQTLQSPSITQVSIIAADPYQKLPPELTSQSTRTMTDESDPFKALSLNLLTQSSLGPAE